MPITSHKDIRAILERKRQEGFFDDDSNKKGPEVERKSDPFAKSSPEDNRDTLLRAMIDQYKREDSPAFGNHAALLFNGKDHPLRAASRLWPHCHCLTRKIMKILQFQQDAIDTPCFKAVSLLAAKRAEAALLKQQEATLKDCAHCRAPFKQGASAKLA